MNPYDPVEDFSRKRARPLQKPNDRTWTGSELFQLEDGMTPLPVEHPEDETTGGDGW